MTGLNRRDLLKRAGKTTTGVGVLSAVGATNATAGDCGTWVDGWNGDYVTTRDYTNCEPDKCCDRAYKMFGLHPSFGESEFHIHIPGWNTSLSEGKEKACGTAYYVNHTNDYPHDVILWDWRSDCGDCTWYKLDDCDEAFRAAYQLAFWEGERLVQFLLDHRAHGGDPPTVSTHSLGGRVFLSALWWAQQEAHWENYDPEYGRLAKSVHLYAAANDYDEVQSGDRATGIWRNTSATFNIYNPDDDALQWGYDPYTGTGKSLGRRDVDSDACNFASLNWRTGDSHDYGKYIRSNTDKMVHQMIYTPSYRSYYC